MMCMVAIRNSDFSRFASETRLRSDLKFSRKLFKKKHPFFKILDKRERHFFQKLVFQVSVKGAFGF